ncbi:MAG: YbfB/YjiJ family MFS transporter [Deltaproteobacteria bacterium]|nr:YbfB/YjiJ family MFS transporter [Deltaproteobacteria bacterium]
MGTMHTTHPEGSLHYGTIVLALIVLAVFCALGLARFGYTSILPAMQQGLGLSNTQTGQLQTLNLLGYLLAVVPAGLLAARFGPRSVIAVSLLVVSLAMILTGLVPAFGSACIGRFLAGVGGAGANVPAMGLVSAWFGSRRRGLASGIGVTGSSLALIVTGPLVPAIIAAGGPVVGWRMSWYALGGLGLVSFFLCALFMRNRPEDTGLLPLGEGADEHARRTCTQAHATLNWKHVYTSGMLWQLAVIYFAFGFSYIIYSTFFIGHLVREAAFTQTAAGLLWMQVGIVSLPSGFIWGSLSDRFGRKIALVCVFTLQAAAFALFGLSLAPAVVYTSAALFALTAWSIPALMAALAGDTFGARLAPAALGLMTIIFGIGQALGPWCAGVLAEAAGSFAGAFIIAGAVALLIGAGGSLTLSTIKK